MPRQKSSRRDTIANNQQTNAKINQQNCNRDGDPPLKDTRNPVQPYPLTDYLKMELCDSDGSSGSSRSEESRMCNIVEDDSKFSSSESSSNAEEAVVNEGYSSGATKSHTCRCESNALRLKYKRLARKHREYQRWSTTHIFILSAQVKEMQSTIADLKQALMIPSPEGAEESRQPKTVRAQLVHHIGERNIRRCEGCTSWSKLVSLLVNLLFERHVLLISTLTSLDQGKLQLLIDYTLERAAVNNWYVTASTIRSRITRKLNDIRQYVSKKTKKFVFEATSV